MINHYLLLAFRNFAKHKVSFLINLVGLTSGLTCTILIALWIQSELETDRFHKENIIQVMQNEHLSDAVNTVEGTPGILAEGLATEFPDVKYAVTVSPLFWLAHSKVGANNIPNVSAAGKIAGPDFFKVFSYPLLHGDPNKVLQGTQTAVISESLAKKLYRSTDVVGKTLSWSNADMQTENKAQITGVFKDIPGQSSEQFDFLISLDVLLGSVNSSYRKWTNYGPNTYAVLAADSDPSSFDAKIKNYLATKDVANYTLFTRSYADAYLYNKLENGKVAGGRIDNVRLFGLAAAIVLLIACINFTNLSTASGVRRLKEIGVQKVLGAGRKSLIFQYLMESIMLSIFALFASLLAAELLLPMFSNIIGKSILLSFNWKLAGMLLSLTLVTGIAAGLYPSIYLSGLKPVNALKGKQIFSSSALWLRQGLVVFQFAFSVILIVGVLVVSNQIRFVQTKSQGFQKDNVVYFETQGKFKAQPGLAINAIKKMDGVLGVGGMDRELLGDLSYTTGEFKWEGRDKNEQIRFQRADVTPGLMETLGMEMAAGRSFSEKFGADTNKIVINQAGIKAMRLKNPVGKIFTLWGNEMQIIGVVEDFHFESMHKAVGPMFIRCKPSHVNRIMVRVAPGKIDQVLKQFKELERKQNTGYQSDIRFLDHDFEQQYLAEIRAAALSRYFAATALVVSCLGLLGLAVFAGKRRFKEIGIRKVLGATDIELMIILSRDFLRPVAVSLFISLPLAYIVSTQWLSSFAYRIELHWWYLALGGLIAVLVAMSAVCYQTYKAATITPIASLKTE